MQLLVHFTDCGSHHLTIFALCCSPSLARSPPQSSFLMTSSWFRNSICSQGNSSRELDHEIAGQGLGARVYATPVHHLVAAPLPVRL